MALDFVAFGLLLTGIIIIIAWISEFFSRISRVPNIVFFLLFALLLAPFIIFFGGIYFDPQLFELIISVSLAVIIFEGGYSFNRCISTVESHLPGHRRKECKPLPFRQLLPHILRLTIIAGITTVVLMTLIFIFFIGFPPLLAGLAGTLCAVTGPTVIIPVLRELKVNEDVAETLQGEGGLNDAIFAVTSGAIFAAIMIEATGLINFILIPILIIFDLGIGVLIGLAIGGVGILIAKYIRPLATLRFGALFNQSILVTLDLIGLLCAAILAFGLGKLFGTEAAIIATLIAGILLGQRHRFEKDGENMKLQNNDEAEEGCLAWRVLRSGNHRRFSFDVGCSSNCRLCSNNSI